MKRILVILLALIIAATSFVSCDQEQKTPGPTPEAHTHAVSETVEAKDATCSAEGNIKYYKCSCGKLFSDEACKTEIALADTVIEKAAHTFDAEVAEWVRVEGTDVYLTVCTVCGEAHGEPAPVSLGMKGPAGGYIFYIAPKPEEAGFRYIETAPAPLGKNAMEEVGIGTGFTKAKFVFGAYFADSEGTAGAANILDQTVGTGKANTAAHVTAMEGHASSSSETYVAMTDYLAKLVSDLSITVNEIVYDDWFIPASNECKLFMVTDSKTGASAEIGASAGLVAGDRIWSSSERDASTNKLKMRTWEWNNATQAAKDRSESYYCLPVRQF